MAKEYAVYKGEELLVMGTINQCASFLKVQPRTIKFYTTPAYHRRVEKRKNPKNYMAVVALDD